MVLDTFILLVPCKDKETIPTQYKPTFSRSILGACTSSTNVVCYFTHNQRPQRECAYRGRDTGVPPVNSYLNNYIVEYQSDNIRSCYFLIISLNPTYF